jgi:hypothetical protein
MDPYAWVFTALYPPNFLANVIDLIGLSRIRIGRDGELPSLSYLVFFRLLCQKDVA